MKTVYLKKIIAIIIGTFLMSIATAFENVEAKPINHKVRSKTKFLRIAKNLADMKVNNILFGFNESVVSPGAYPELNRIVKVLIENNASIKLGGYADNKGSYVYNWKLSKVRAESVKTYLVKNGADSTRIAATEYGDTHPIATNTTKSGRKKNRRVEVQFIQ